MDTEVRNADLSPLVSDVLRFAVEIERSEGREAEIMFASETGAKAGIVATILVGLATRAIYDLLKAAISRVRLRPDYDGTQIIEIAGKSETLEDISRRGGLSE